MDIVTLPIVIDKEKMVSRFRMVVLATQRARQLLSGAKPTVPVKYTKESTIALQELLECKFEYVTGKEARKALEETASKGLQGTEEEVEVKDETKKEIEKDLGVYVPESEDSTETESLE